ncbi:GNAT family N-acetyltransferase [Actinomadura luteofluorescens]|uniref:RimJ/RimL family protein N-acetyltransferase n=1 Tax=Actinomadura luteofluorescens TaxID=46163 RepID=A0A7Y9EC11_9ACTN|nr:GNAT family N-acetyltransferase [Actinomadura luteofluorescens]NYD44701.1 RimJ/RimL family protein N-acetyltransferase [Actinomadura luteofluorescens]
MPQPILHTERLLLVPLADRHLDLEVYLDSDLEVLRYLDARTPTRHEVVATHQRRMAMAGKVDGLGFWMAHLSAEGEEGEFVGLMMLPPAHGLDQPDDPTVCDLGYRLVRRHWRQGLASEASRALLRHAFDTVGQSRVIAQTMAANAGSIGVMRAIGMRYVRTYYPQFDDPLPDAHLGEVEYEMTRTMWEEMR